MTDTLSYIMFVVIYVAVVAMSAILHEYMHGWTANQLGDKTPEYFGRLTLNPLVHIDPFYTILLPILTFVGSGGTFMFGAAKPVPFNPYNLRNQKYGPAIVGIAGPLTNIFLAVVFAVIFRFNILGDGFSTFASLVVVVNVALAVVNLIPVPPLDGSRLLTAFAPSSWHNTLMIFERYGLILIIAIVYVLGPIIGTIIGAVTTLLLGQPLGT